MSADHFATFGLPRAFAVDASELETRFRELSRNVHPDRFARAPPRERRLALAAATALNDAYRTLRHPRRRAEHLLALRGVEVGARGGAPVEPEFLEAQLELRERLAAARAQGDREAVARVAADARAALARIDREIAFLLAAETSDEALRPCADALARARFYEGLAAAAEVA